MASTPIQEFASHLVVQWLESFQLQGALSADHGLSPWTPLGAMSPEPHYRLVLAIFSPKRTPYNKTLDPCLCTFVWLVRAVWQLQDCGVLKLADMFLVVLNIISSC